MTAHHKGAALHLGLNHVDPDHYQGWDGELAGCQNDARDLQAIAAAAGFETTLFLDEQASAEPVKAAITKAAGALAAGDVFLLTYSGHGSQVPDKNGDETEDGYDETWVLFDRQLVDDELYALWSKFPAGVRVVVLSDSCHSGSAIRETLDSITPDALGARLSIPKPNGMRTMPKAQQHQGKRTRRSTTGSRQPSRRGDTVEITANVLLLSGCQDNQTSADGKRNGLFTQTLLEVWDSGKYKGGYKRFYDTISTRCRRGRAPTG